MGDFIKSIPLSFINLSGLFVLTALLIVVGTWFQEWGKTQFKRFIGKDKRHEPNGYLGNERRINGLTIEQSIANLLEAQTEFITAVNQSHADMKEQIDKVSRKQDYSWNRLFKEELPNLKHK